MKKYICGVSLLVSSMLTTAVSAEDIDLSYDYIGMQTAEMGCMGIYSQPNGWGKPHTIPGNLSEDGVGEKGIYNLEHGDRATYKWVKEQNPTDLLPHLDGEGICYKYHGITNELECEYRIGYSLDHINEYGEHLFKFVPLSRLCHINPE